VLQVFDEFTDDSSRNLELVQSLDGDRYLWGIVPAAYPSAALFAEIALPSSPISAMKVHARGPSVSSDSSCHPEIPPRNGPARTKDTFS
jgi:hypothetical protein